MNQHRAFREMLARCAELDPAEEARLRHHLERCEECSQLAETYAMQDALLASLPPVRPPAELRAAVLRSVDGLASAPLRRWPAFFAHPADSPRGADSGPPVGGSQWHPEGTRREPRRRLGCRPTHSRGPRYAKSPGWWAGAYWAALASALGLLLLMGGGLLAGSVRHGTPETTRVLAQKGYELATPHGSVLVSRRAAERVALALFPGQVQRSVLAAVRNERTPAFRGQSRLCWIVSIVPPSGTGFVPPANPWLDGMSAQQGEIAHVRYFLVFVDARTGAFVLASSADTI